VCFDFLCKFCLKCFSFEEKFSEIWSKAYIGLHVKWPLFLSDFNENWIFSTDFRRIFKCAISRNPTSGSEFIPRRQIQTDRRTDGRTGGQTDITRLIVAFRNFAEEAKIHSVNTDIFSAVSSVLTYLLHGAESFLRS